MLIAQRRVLTHAQILSPFIDLYKVFPHRGMVSVERSHSAKSSAVSSATHKADRFRVTTSVKHQHSISLGILTKLCSSWNYQVKWCTVHERETGRE